MEIESIEKLLQDLGLGSQVNLFKQNELGLKLLMSLSDTELKEALTELKLPLGNRLLIIKKIREIKDRGKFALFRKYEFGRGRVRKSTATVCANKFS